MNVLSPVRNMPAITVSSGKATLVVCSARADSPVPASLSSSRVVPIMPPDTSANACVPGFGQP
jgi:hypothetical protein